MRDHGITSCDGRKRFGEEVKERMGAWKRREKEERVASQLRERRKIVNEIFLGPIQINILTTCNYPIALALNVFSLTQVHKSILY
jgi:hypothetical protein